MYILELLRGGADAPPEHTLAAADAELDRRMPARLVLDFAGVGFMDSSGIGLILGRQRHMQALGGSLCIRSAPAQIGKVLELAGIENMKEANK